jgi:CRISPR-associated protein Cas1
LKTRVCKIFLDESGSYLGRKEGCLIVRDKNRKVKKFALFENEIGEIQIKSGNYVSSGALATCAFWRIDTLFLTERGNPIAFLKSLEDDSHVETRIAQYEAHKSSKGVAIAKQIVLGKIEGQNYILRKYGLRQHDFMRIKDAVNGVKSDDLRVLRNKLITIEGHCGEFYFNQIFQLIPEAFRPEKRRGFKAYDGINNSFNLGYEILRWKVHKALLKAKLEPFLGFLHSTQVGKPSLVCDFMELYRYLIDDFLIQYCKTLRKKDFAMQREDYSSNRKGKREYLNNDSTRDFMRKLNTFFETVVEIPRIKHGKRQTVETLIDEEALLLAKYLRNEKQMWIPRTPFLNPKAQHGSGDIFRKH